MDEFPEFDRNVIDALRQPLEDHVITISRASGTSTFPAQVILVVAMNPCPCGNYGVAGRSCSCTPLSLGRYQRKISGPIIDRIDLWTEVSIINHAMLAERTQKTETTEIIKNRVKKARDIQAMRYKNHPRNISMNGEMNARDIPIYANIEPEAKKILSSSAERMNLSARAHHRLIKLARTIADLSNKEKTDTEAVLEALQYRPKRLA